MRATSRKRTIRPWASVLSIMSANWSTSTNRPSVVMVYWKTWPPGTGGWPICPAATWAFCCWIVATTSLAARFSFDIFSGSSQSRML